MDRFTAGSYDDTNYAVYDREEKDGNYGWNIHSYGYMTLDDAQKRARELNEAAKVLSSS